MKEAFMEEFKEYALLSDDIEEERLLRKELRQFNWGAFVFTWIWGCFNGIYQKTILALILLVIAILVPCVAWVAYLGLFGCAIYYGIYGNRWVYNEKRVRDIPTFIDTQKKWACAGLIFTILSIVLSTVIFIVSMLFVGKVASSSGRGEIIMKTMVKTMVKSDNYASFKDGSDIAADVLAEPKKSDADSDILPYGAAGVQFVVKTSGKPTSKIAMSFYKNGACDIAKKNCFIYYYEAPYEGDFVPVSKGYFSDSGEVRVVALKQKKK